MGLLNTASTDKQLHTKVKSNIVHLLDDLPPLALSLNHRDLYLDPLNHIQIKLLKSYRDELLDSATREK